MVQEELFANALGISDPWYVKRVSFNLETAVGRGAEYVIFFALQGESEPLVQ
jgi:hypothetical protein